MKKYKLLLTGGESFVIEEPEKQVVDLKLKSKDDAVVTIRGNTIKPSAIKAMIELSPEIKYGSFDQKMDEENQAWGKLCEEMSMASVQEKTDREMNTRILPGWRLCNRDEGDAVLSEAYAAILDFFTQNKNYPRCPSRVWWPLISGKLKQKPFVSLWYEYVFRNDQMIEKWIKFRKPY